MLPDDTIIIVVANHDDETMWLPKKTIVESVRALFLAESSASIAPDEKVREELARVLVAHCLEAR